MSSTKRGCIAAALTLAASSQLMPATAQADPVEPIDPVVSIEAEAQPQPEPEVLHNVVYRARVDGVSRGATITYAAEGERIQTASPTMVPGRTFEVNTVLPGSDRANVRVSIDWPYSANLHCEILVNDAVVAKADDFIGPRLTPARDDPDYGALTCEAPVGVAAMPSGVGAAPVDGVPAEGALPQPETPHGQDIAPVA